MPEGVPAVNIARDVSSVSAMAPAAMVVLGSETDPSVNVGTGEKPESLLPHLG